MYVAGGSRRSVEREGNRVENLMLFLAFVALTDCAKSCGLWYVHAKGTSKPFSSLQAENTRWLGLTFVWEKEHNCTEQTQTHGAAQGLRFVHTMLGSQDRKNMVRKSSGSPCPHHTSFLSRPQFQFTQLTHSSIMAVRGWESRETIRTAN